jgi:hypothetical protein
MSRRLPRREIDSAPSPWPMGTISEQMQFFLSVSEASLENYTHSSDCEACDQEALGLLNMFPIQVFS